jgi:hypothetical protein
MSVNQRQQKLLKQIRKSNFVGLNQLISLSLISMGLFVSCATTPKTQKTVSGERGHARGEWRGQAFVKDTAKKKSGTFEIEILAEEPARLRLEATGPFGMSVASLSANEKEAVFLLPREKKFLRDAPDSDRISALVPVRLAPQELLAILFDREQLHGAWKCVNDAQGQLLKCAKSHPSISFTVDRPKEFTRKINVSTLTSEAQILLIESKANVEFTDKTFNLIPPADYIDLRAAPR